MARLLGQPSDKEHRAPGAPGSAAVMVDLEAQAGTTAVAAPPRFGRSPTQTRLLTDVHPNARVSVVFNNVCAFVPVLVVGAAPGVGNESSQQQEGKEAPPKERQVLFDITACVEPGEMLALMGPSGSGKSSLLTILGGRSTARIGGSVTFNGQPLAKSSKRKLGFVSQDDLLFAELTVYETLYFAAMLRLPTSWTYEAKVQRAEMVLQGLGLDKCRDTIIGNHMMRGVSGGERKRVSIGHELLINPSVLFLDEPTSGLDSTTALKLLHTLRSLASGGRTIITSIHQPSSRLYQQMDKLLLLAEGRTMYFGDAHVAAHWFGHLKQPVPFGVSTADHLLDLACGDLPGHSREESKAIMDMLVEAFRDRTIGLGRHGILPEHLGQEAVSFSRSVTRERTAFNASLARGNAAAASAGALHPLAEGTGSRDQEDAEASRPSTSTDEEGAALASVEMTGGKAAGASPRKANGVSFAPETVLEVKGGEDGAGPGSEEPEPEVAEGKWGATWTEQIKYLTQRSLKTRRFSALSIQRIVEVTCVGILAGLFWWQAGKGGVDPMTTQQALDVGGLLFFEVLFLAFSSLFQAIFNYPAEFHMLVKERQSGMYRLSAYYIARSLSDLPMDCVLPSVLLWILYFFGGLKWSAAAFFGNWFAVLLSVLIAQSMGLLIGATVTNIKNCLMISTILMLSLMLVGGYYVRGIPIWISWLKYVSFIYWAWNLTLMIEFRGQSVVASACNPPSDTCTVGQANLFVVDVDAVPYKEAVVLVAMLIILRVATYYALNYKTTFKKRS